MNEQPSTSGSSNLLRRFELNCITHQICVSIYLSNTYLSGQWIATYGIVMAAAVAVSVFKSDYKV